MRLLLRKLLRDLRRQRVPFAAVTVTVFLGTVLFSASYDAYQDLSASYDALFAQLHFADVTMSGGGIDAFAAQARGVPGVDAVQTRTVADVPVAIGDHRLLARVVGMPSGRQPTVDQVLVLSGEYLSEGQPSGVLVERHLADHFRLQPGDTVEVVGPTGLQPLRVQGVVASAEYIWPARSRQDILTTPDQFGVIFAPESLVESAASAAGRREALVRLGAGADRSVALTRLDALAQSSRVAAITTQDDQPSNAALHEDISGFGELALAFPALFLGASALALYVLLSRLVRIQRGQIGTLLANGVRRRTVLLHYLGYGLVPSLVGGVLGALVGVAAGRSVTGVYTAAISIPITVTNLHPGTALVGVAVAGGVGVLAALAPAVAAFRVTPAEAMRGEVPRGAGRRSLAERLIPGLRRLPAGGKLVMRGISRAPRRTAATVLGVILAVTLVLAAWGMLDTTSFLVDRQFGQVDRQDGQVHPVSGVDAALLARLEAVPGVAAVEPVAELEVTVAAGGSSYPTVLRAFPPQTAMHGFQTAGGTTEDLPADGILAGAPLGSRLGLGTGAKVDVVIPSLGITVHETIRGFVSEPLGTYVYTSLPALMNATGHSGLATSAMVRYAAGADRSTMQARLAAVSGIAVVSDAHALADAVNSYMALFYAFVGVMLVFGAAMAGALIVSIMSVTVGERSVEFATLRGYGVPARRIARLVTDENLLVTLGALLPGLAVGWLATRWFLASFSSDLFQFDAHIRATTFLGTALAIVVVSVLSQLPALRALGRLDLAATMRERAL